MPKVGVTTYFIWEHSFILKLKVGGYNYLLSGGTLIHLQAPNEAKR